MSEVPIGAPRRRWRPAARALLSLGVAWALAASVPAGPSLAAPTAPAAPLAASGAADTITGIDVAGHQHPNGAPIDWTEVVGAGHSFVFVKATEGSTYVNPYFADDISDAAAAGLYRGAYHFARPGTGTATAQAEHFVATAGLLAQVGDLPPVLDLEVTGDLTPAQLATWAREWLGTVERLTGRVPVLYTSPSFWTDRMAASTGFTRHPLWIAHYTSATAPRVPAGWTGWSFWQRTNQGSVAGIEGNVDLNEFNGTAAGLAALAGAGPAEPPGPEQVSTSLALRADRAQLRRGVTARLRGRLTAAGRGVAGSAVQLLQRATGSKRWSVVRRARTDAQGRLVLAVRPRRTTAYRLAFTATATRAASTSGTVRIRVR